MNYLITGGRGFIGCHVVRQLLRAGHTVLCTAHNLDKTSMHEVLTPEEVRQVEIVKADIGDTAMMTQLMREHKIDRVIHLAAVLGDVAERDPAEAVRINILGTISVFQACVDAGVKRVVWACSQSSFGTEEFYRQLYPNAALVPNNAVMHPALVYGATKVFDEFIAEWFYKKYGLETIGLRYCMVFGVARQRGNGQFATELINKPALGEKGVVNYGDTAPCWIYVEDAARATVLATQCPDPQDRVFTIGGDIRSLADCLAYIRTLIPEADVELVPGVFPAAFNLDISEAERQLGFKCEYSVEQGIHETINLLRAEHGLPAV